MSTEIGYITLDSADDYFETRLGAGVWNDMVDDTTRTKATAALTTAFDRLYYSGLFDLPTLTDASAAELVILKKFQCEMALYMLIHLEDEDRRKGLQAQGVVVAGIVKETYSEKDLHSLPIPPFIMIGLEDYSTEGQEMYVAPVDRDEELDIEF